MMHTNILQNINATLESIAYPTTPQGLYEPIRYVLSIGGKRLRPTLLLLSYSLYKDDYERALPAAIGLETYHNHTLLHDDLMDNADMRRGMPTVHKKWNENTAVLSGDTMLILAFKHIMSCVCTKRNEILELFTKTAIEICEGQQYDVNFETRTDVTVAEYLEMIRLKTSVLLACAAKMGALAADAPAADAEILYMFAEKVGLAFQLQDDYLDVYGDPKIFGKKIGGDILCGKKTYLLINALERADEGSRETLLSLLNDHEMLPEDKISRVTNIYNCLNIPETTLSTINHIFEEAHSLIARLSIPETKWQLLWNYAESMLGRKK